MNLLDMSLSGAALILAVTVLRAVAIHRLPKRAFLVLWAVALGRLLIPYTLPSALSVYTLLERLTTAQEVAVGMAINPALPVVPVANHVTAGVTPAVLAATSQSVDWPRILWLVGALVCGGYFAASYLRCRREFRQALPAEHPALRAWLDAHPLRRTVSIRVCERVSTPLTYGVLRPVILLPKTMDQNDSQSLDYVLAHELIHIRRFDGVTKLALAAALCLHWFNPAVWVMYALANRDLELSCDQAVVWQFGADARAAYATALIRMEEVRGGGASLYNSFSKNAMEERIVAIMKFKKTSLAALVLAVGLVIGVTVAFATSAKPQDNDLPPAGSQLENPAKSTIEVQRITSYVDPYDGKTYYSVDNGQTWLEGDVFAEAGYDLDRVDWWTAQEYEQYLEELKQEYQSMLGEKSWNPTEGWYTWDQARIDAAIAASEQLLQEIRDGKLVSKPTADGDTMIQFSYDPRAIHSVEEAGRDAQETQALLDTYAPFGLQYTYDLSDPDGGLRMTWQGKSVHSVYDAKTGAWIANNLHGLDLGPNAIDLQAVYDSNGNLTGVKEEKHPAHSERQALSLEDILFYSKLGVTFDSNGKMFYQGEPMGWFADVVELADGGWASRYIYADDTGTQRLRTVRQRKDNGDGSYDPFGSLTGIVPITDKEADQYAPLFQNNLTLQITAETTAAGNTVEDNSVDFRDAFNEKFGPYGVSFVPSGTFGNVYWNGRLASAFVDDAPDGKYQTLRSLTPGGVELRAVYDSNGSLTGVEEVKRELKNLADEPEAIQEYIWEMYKDGLLQENTDYDLSFFAQRAADEGVTRPNG